MSSSGLPSIEQQIGLLAGGERTDAIVDVLEAGARLRRDADDLERREPGLDQQLERRMIAGSGKRPAPARGVGADQQRSAGGGERLLELHFGLQQPRAAFAAFRRAIDRRQALPRPQLRLLVQHREIVGGGKPVHDASREDRQRRGHRHLAPDQRLDQFRHLRAVRFQRQQGVSRRGFPAGQRSAFLSATKSVATTTPCSRPSIPAAAASWNVTEHR